jgi:collagenase-like PrtC family protease
MKEVILECRLSRDKTYVTINGTIKKNEIKTIPEKFRPKKQYNKL